MFCFGSLVTIFFVRPLAIRNFFPVTQIDMRNALVPTTIDISYPNSFNRRELFFKKLQQIAMLVVVRKKKKKKKKHFGDFELSSKMMVIISTSHRSHTRGAACLDCSLLTTSCLLLDVLPSAHQKWSQAMRLFLHS